MNDQIAAWAPRIGVERACGAFGCRRARGATSASPRRAARVRAPPGRWRPTSGAHPARVPDAQRAEIRALLCSERFCDLAPAQIYTTLLDEGLYVCSERTMYRILHEADQVRETRRGHRRSPKAVPRVHATGPNQAWSYDISRLAGPVPRSWFYPYVVLDIFSRKIVAWSVDTV